jgi:hypothetical protein
MPSYFSVKFIFFVLFETFCIKYSTTRALCTEFEYVIDRIARSDRKCMSEIPVSFESCRFMLANSELCDVLIFRNKLCSLLDDSSSQYVESDDNEKSILIRKITKEGDCEKDREYIPAVRQFRSCLNKSKSHTDHPPEHLPRLAIVISVTSDWADSHQAGVAAMRSNFDCYAAAHNYSFVSLLFFLPRH